MAEHLYKIYNDERLSVIIKCTEWFYTQTRSFASNGTWHDQQNEFLMSQLLRMSFILYQTLKQTTLSSCYVVEVDCIIDFIFDIDKLLLQS